MITCTAVTGRNDIPEADFPDHVKQMHLDRDQKLELEYRVSYCHTCCVCGECCVVCVQSLDKTSQPASEVGHLSHNLPHNRFKNICPCELQ